MTNEELERLVEQEGHVGDQFAAGVILELVAEVRSLREQLALAGQRQHELRQEASNAAYQAEQAHLKKVGAVLLAEGNLKLRHRVMAALGVDVDDDSLWDECHGCGDYVDLNDHACSQADPTDRVDAALEQMHKVLGHQECRWRDCNFCNTLAATIRLGGGPLL